MSGAPDPLSPDKLALRKSQAGMRFIAQMHLYNQENPERLRQFIADSYHDDLLAVQSVEQRLDELQSQINAWGKLRVKQVLAANEHHVIVIMEAQNTPGFYYTEFKVEPDYPHKITFYLFQPMQEVT